MSASPSSSPSASPVSSPVLGPGGIKKDQEKLKKGKKHAYDSEADAQAHVKEVAQLLRAAKHAVVFTGTEISASKIPGEKGADGTWTLKDRPKPLASGEKVIQAVPTYAHMALALLVKNGLVKHVVTTNIDGIHRTSGLPGGAVSELRGNFFKEVCNMCSQEYLRDFDTTSHGCRKDHLTGRNCEKCPGQLLDCIIHSGEPIPPAVLMGAMLNSQQADLAIVLGTPLSTSPIVAFPPLAINNGGKLVICNMRETILDGNASKLIHMPLDNFMQLLVEELGLKSNIPSHTPEGYPVVHKGPYIPNTIQEQENKQQKKGKAKLNVIATSTNNNNYSPPLPRSPKSALTPPGPRKLVGVDFQLNARPTGHVTGKTGETSDINLTHRNEMAYIRACTNCSFTIKTGCMKIIIERVNTTNVTVNGHILTGMCEVIASSDFTLTFNTIVPTVTVDKCTNGTIVFSGTENVHEIIWSNCTGLRVQVGAQVHEIPSAQTLRPDVDPELAQFRTRWANGRISNELLVREGAGYVTTEREKQINDDRDERNKFLFDMAMGVKFTQPPTQP